MWRWGCLDVVGEVAGSWISLGTLDRDLVSHVTLEPGEAFACL
jgi:hypothetical protein